MDLCGGMHRTSVLSFHNKYNKQLKMEGEYEKADPYFDGWMMFIGKQRNAFDAEMFLETYPSVKKKIMEIRERCSLQMGVVDRTENKRSVLNEAILKCFFKAILNEVLLQRVIIKI